MALTRPEVDDVPQKVKDLADAALKKAEEWKLIKTNTGESIEEDSDQSEYCNSFADLNTLLISKYVYWLKNFLGVR